MTGPNEYLVQRAKAQQEEARLKYVEACEWLVARNLTEAAERARDGQYVSESVTSSSLVQDIPKYATVYSMLGQTIRSLQGRSHHAFQPEDK